jgi:tyrosine-protein kinase
MDRVLSAERPSLDRILRAARGWGLWIALGALVAGIAAFLISEVLPAEYQATAQLYVTPASSSTVIFQDVVLGQNLARTYVALVTAEVVLRPAMTKVGWTDLTTFRERTQAAQVRDTSVMNVSFRDRDAARAALAANAIAESFIEQSRTLQSTLQTTTADQLDEQVRSLQAEIASLDTQIARLRTATAAPADPTLRAQQQAELAQADASRQSKQQTLAQLAKASDDIRIAGARGQNSVSLWQPATAPTEPVSPKVGLNTLLGALGGAVAAALAVGLITYLDDRMKDLEAVRARLGIPTMGEVTRAEHPEAIAGKLFVRDEPSSTEAEAFRALRTNISFANVDRRPQTILVTSAMPLEGKSVVSANLALAFAQTGTPTILVDADLRRPSQHKLFNVSSSAGLTNLLAGTLQATAMHKFRISPQLAVIPSGPLPPNPAELLSSNKMTALLKELVGLSEGTVVIVDTSPVLAVTDAAALAPNVDGCLLVIDSGTTQARLTRRAVESLRRVNAVILGAILNKIGVQGPGYYYEAATEPPTPPSGAATRRAGDPRTSSTAESS